MGCLDPRLDKVRTFELLRKKSATKAVLVFSGGHDQGDVESITLTVELANGETTEQDLEVWYCGGYRLGPESREYVPINKAENEDQELSDLLQGPVDQTFGSWGGVESTYGTLTWDVAEETATLSYDQDEPRRHEVTW